MTAALFSLVILGICFFAFGIAVWKILKKAKETNGVTIVEYADEIEDGEDESQRLEDRDSESFRPTDSLKREKTGSPFLAGENYEASTQRMQPESKQEAERADEQGEMLIHVSDTDEVRKGFIYSEILNPKY